MGKFSAKGPRAKAKSLPDWHLWSEVTRSISPLPRRVSLSRKPKVPTEIAPKMSRAEDSQRRHQHALEARKSTPSNKVSWSPGSSLGPAGSFSHSLDRFQLPILDPKIHRKVRRGQICIDGTIDLHGLHQNEARSALYRFIEARIAYGDRTLLVITGKGMKKTGFGQLEQRGVLRHMLPLWLKEPALAPLIAGFETSARQHGGEGAYYVRLKRGGA